MRWANSYIQRFKGAKFGWTSRCRQSGIYCWLHRGLSTRQPPVRPAISILSLVYSPSHIYHICLFLCLIIFWHRDLHNACLKWLRTLWYFVLDFYSILLWRFYITYRRRRKYLWVCVHTCMHRHMVSVWRYWYAHVYVCVGGYVVHLPFYLPF